MITIDRDDLRVTEEAASWLLRLGEDESPACRTEFFRWLRMSPHHAQEFMLVKATSVALNHADVNRTIDVSSVEADPEENVIAFPEAETARGFFRQTPRSPARSPGTAWRRVAIAAGLVGIGLALLLLQSEGVQRRTYTTQLGNQTAIKLSDGSVMHLNAQSRAEVRFTEHKREVELVEGEALFFVEHDAERPFTVVTAYGTVQAVGTEFNVYKRKDGLRVSVVEGVVQIVGTGRSALTSPNDKVPDQTAPQHAPPVIRLVAGEEALVAPGHIAKTDRPDVEKAVAWRARRLVFRGDALETVVGEFNRYNRIQIRIDGGVELRARRVSGVFDADDPQPLIQFLENDQTLIVEKRPYEIIVRARNLNVPLQAGDYLDSGEARSLH